MHSEPHTARAVRILPGVDLDYPRKLKTSQENLHPRQLRSETRIVLVCELSLGDGVL